MSEGGFQVIAKTVVLKERGPVVFRASTFPYPTDIQETFVPRGSGIYANLDMSRLLFGRAVITMRNVSASISVGAVLFHPIQTLLNVLLPIFSPLIINLTYLRLTYPEKIFNGQNDFFEYAENRKGEGEEYGKITFRWREKKITQNT